MGYLLTLEEAEEIKTLLRIAAFDWKNEFEKTGRTSLRGLEYAANRMYDRLEELMMREIIKGIEYKIRENLAIKIEATPRDANEEEKPNKQYCIVLFKELYGDHYKVYHKVLTIPELKELMGFKKKEVISWS